MGMLWLWTCRGAHRNPADGTDVHLNWCQGKTGQRKTHQAQGCEGAWKIHRRGAVSC